MFLSGFCHFGLVYTWFCDRDLTLPSCLVFLWAHDLSSVCFVSWWSFGSRHSCLVQVLVPGRGSDTHAPCSFLLWEPAVLSSLGPCAPLSTCFVFCFAYGSCSAVFSFSCSCVVAHSLFYQLHAMFLSCAVLHAACFFFHWLHAFMFKMVCVKTWLMSH